VLGPAPYASPRLPGTQAKLVAAEKQVTRFPLPPIPGRSQTFPHQPHGTKPIGAAVPSSAQAAKI